MTPLDELGLAITNAGYTWTPEMRKAYEKGVRIQNRGWVGLTDQEKENFENTWDVGPLQVEAIEAKLKEKNT
jgi:hypothetical protein